MTPLSVGGEARRSNTHTHTPNLYEQNTVLVPLPLPLPLCLRRPQLLGDSDTLSSRKISDGAAIHLFQRPKLVPSSASYASSSGGGGGSGAGLDTAPAQQPGMLHEIPPLLLQVQEGSEDGYLSTHWEVDVPRRGIRFLASFLLLMSMMQVRSVMGLIGRIGGIKHATRPGKDGRRGERGMEGGRAIGGRKGSRRSLGWRGGGGGGIWHAAWPVHRLVTKKNLR